MPRVPPARAPSYHTFPGAAAIVSTSAIHRAAISMIVLVSRRRLEVFDSRSRALEWLVTKR